MNIILTGFQGVGKSTYGRALAQKIRRPFIDTDQLLSPHEPVSALYQKLGDELFRQKELEVLLKLAEVKNSVIAVGGGALTTTHAQNYLPTLGALYYLYLPLPILLSLLDARSPVFLDPKKPQEAMEKLYELRHPVFTSCCKHRIEIHNLQFDEVLEKILGTICL